MLFLWFICAYFIGAVPFGLLIARHFCRIDPRTAGSYNVGSTNVARLCGKKYGLMTLVCDILKGALPVSVALLLSGSMLYVSLVSLVAVLGHVFSCFLAFKGGKAVATSIGIFIPLAIGPLLCAVVVCLGLIYVSGFVSAGSLSLVLSLPVFLVFFGSWSLLPLALCIMALVVWTHRANIQRLIGGAEKSWKKNVYNAQKQ